MQIEAVLKISESEEARLIVSLDTLYRLVD